MTDKYLWDNLRLGEHSALEKIYSSHFEYLYNYAKRVSTDSALVEDSIQDLFVELWNKRANLGETDAIRPYLIVSLRRKIIRTLQKSKATTNIDEESDFNFKAELAIEDILIQKDDNNEKKEKLAKAFKDLSNRQKEVLYLKYYSDMDNQSIAESMGISYQSVRNLSSKALQQLGKLLLVGILCFIIFL